HVVSRLRRDDELVTIGAEVLRVDPAEALLGRPVRRPVVVRQVEVRHATVERAAQHCARALERAVATEVLPEAERDRGQLQPPAPAPPVLHPVVAVVRRDIRHRHAPWSLARACHARTGPTETPSVVRPTLTDVPRFFHIPCNEAVLAALGTGRIGPRNVVRPGSVEARAPDASLRTL